MICYNGVRNLGILPNQIQDGLKSKSLIAKKMATALNANVQDKIAYKEELERELDVLDNDDFDLIERHPVPFRDETFMYTAKTNNLDNVVFRSGFNFCPYYFKYSAPSEREDKYIFQSFMKPEFYGGQLRNCYLSMSYTNKTNTPSMDASKGLRMVSDKDNSKSMVWKIFDYVYVNLGNNKRIPLPALKTENNQTKTVFIPIEKVSSYNEIPLELLFDSQIDVNTNSFEMGNLDKFVGTINENAPLKAQEFKNQYNNIEYFQINKNEVFDKPIELAEIAFNKITNDTIDEKIILDIGNAGDRIEVEKQGDIFNIDYYGKDNKLSMQGLFILLKDAQGVPLKEDEDGKILNQNDVNYNKPQNKLCFDMKLTTYHQYTDVKSFDFKRTINLDDKKQRHNISMACYDKKDNLVMNKNFVLPKYSKNWLEKRMCKIWHNIYKTDLKEAKANFEHDMIHIDDLDPNLKNG